MANAPAIKPWCKEDKEKLKKLIGQNKVDIANTDNTNCINSVHHKHFCEQKIDGLRRNFCSTRSVDIEEHFTGYRAHLAAGG